MYVAHALKRLGWVGRTRGGASVQEPQRQLASTTGPGVGAWAACCDTLTCCDSLRVLLSVSGSRLMGCKWRAQPQLLALEGILTTWHILCAGAICCGSVYSGGNVYGPGVWAWASHSRGCDGLDREARGWSASHLQLDCTTLAVDQKYLRATGM